MVRPIGLITLVAGAFVAAVLLLPHSPADLRTLALGAGIAAPAIALGAWVLLTPAMFPGTLLAAACGLAFGALGGAAVSMAGAVLGGLAAFALSRTVASSHVEGLLVRRPGLQRVHRLLESRSFLAMLTAAPAARSALDGAPGAGVCRLRTSLRQVRSLGRTARGPPRQRRPARQPDYEHGPVVPRLSPGATVSGD
jgi:hypothetical protein